MSEYEFELRFALPSCDMDPDQLVERLGGVGCDDALIGVGRQGQVALDFTREAESAMEAVLSAIADVRRALPEARLIEVSPDLVGVTDVGRLLSVTRQNVRKLLLSCEALPPVALHEGKPALWHLATVLDWLAANKHYQVPERLSSLAWATMQVNLVVSSREVDKKTQREVLTLLR